MAVTREKCSWRAWRQRASALYGIPRNFVVSRRNNVATIMISQVKLRAVFIVDTALCCMAGRKLFMKKRREIFIYDVDQNSIISSAII